jgi:anti-anti-sigma regulatory factor
MFSTNGRMSHAAIGGVVAVSIGVLITTLPNFEEVSGCIRSAVWPSPLIALHVGSDILIALAYLAIPGSLLLLRSRRDDIPVDWITTCFAAFILLCGITHVMNIITVWHPMYWVSGKIKAATGLVSIATAALLQFRVLPILLNLPTREQMDATLAQASHAAQMTTEANAQLEAQASELRTAKEAAEREAAAARKAREITEVQAAIVRAAQMKAEQEAAMARDAIGALEKASAEKDARDGELREAMERERALAATIRECSVPVLLVIQEPPTLLVPIIGVIDSMRAEQLMDTVTRDVVAYQARTVIIDLKGVGIVDTQVANTILEVVKVVRLLGAQCVLTSIGPAIASTIVKLGLDLGPNLPTLGSLASGLEVAMARRKA